MACRTIAFVFCVFYSCWLIILPTFGGVGLPGPQRYAEYSLVALVFRCCAIVVPWGFR